MGIKNIVQYIRKEHNKPVSATPFQVFRACWGGLMAFSTIRFMALGWIEDHYIEPQFHFKYWGFEWVEPLPTAWLYAIHVLLIAASIGIVYLQGWAYRCSAFLLFLTFTYTELIDLTYYLNHYYFVSLVCFLFCVIPSPPPLWQKGALMPVWVIYLFKFQISIVYIYAGLAKINHEWLFRGMPLKLWLPAHDTLPLVGPVFTWKITPYLFAWAGMLYDCTIPFFLLWRKTRALAYAAVVVFHVLVGLLFQIGVFPMVMIASTLLFFDFAKNNKIQLLNTPSAFKPIPKMGMFLLGCYIIFQLLFPWRYLLYKGNLFWSEEGYRYSWRVMLMEKAGTALFYVKDTRTGREGVVDNSEFLNPHQEKQMAMQPDMILQFAHFLATHYMQKGVHHPQVRAEVYVTLNGRPSRLLIDPTVDLTKEKDTFAPKKWVIHYND